MLEVERLGSCVYYPILTSNYFCNPLSFPTIVLADNDDDDDAGAAPDDWLMAANVALDAALGLNPPLKLWTTQELQSAINRRPETMVSALVVHRRRRAGCAALQAPGQADAMSRNWTPAASTAPLRGRAHTPHTMGGFCFLCGAGICIV